MKRYGLVFRGCLGFVFLWFLIGGIGHFTSTDFFASIVPPYILLPPRLVVQITGVFELLGAAGLIMRRTRSLAAWSLFLFTICVTPANVYMLQHHELFATVPKGVLAFRLFLQIGLLACIYRCTKPEHSLTNV